MKNDTMFGTLERYEEEKFRQENPTFNLITPEQTRTEFSELIGWLQESSLYMLGEQSAYGEQILLLSTCSYHTENGRFLVAARRIE